jgi:hypothetical protein
LTDDRPSQTPVRANRSRRKKKTSPFLIVIPLALVAGAVALFLFVSKGEGGGIPFIGDSGPEAVPAFDFTVTSVTTEATSDKTDAATLPAEAQKVADQVVPVLDQLYTEGFLDPNNWKDGEYDEVWEVFDASALPSAQEDVETLTLGVDAGDTFDSVGPDEGTLKIRVLFDEAGKPVSAVAVADFTAFGDRKDGKYVKFVSHGQYFLRDSGDGWTIYSFDVQRNDQSAARSTPTPAPSASAASSGS